jgi:hypothetical protein
MNGVHGFKSWQWLFIVEGIPAIGLGFIILFFLPSFPDIIAKRGSRYFTNAEIELALQRMEECKFLLEYVIWIHTEETLAANSVTNEKIEFSQILIALKDPKTFFTAIIYGALCLGIASITSFLPTFIREFGFGKCKSS